MLLTRPDVDQRTRRDVVALLGAAAWQLPARAQPSAMPVLGYLGPEAPERFASRLAAFRKGLAESGYVEGRNVAIDFRWADGHYDRLPALAADLVQQNVALIVAPGGAPVVLAAKAATTTVPIVFELGGDPIALGVVGSLSRPGGNLTGISSLNVEVSPKRLELMREALPSATAFVAVFNPTSPTAASQLGNLQAAADGFGLRLHALPASAEHEFDAVFQALPGLGASGLVFTSDPYFAFRSQKLALLSVRHAAPAVTQSRDFPMADGLMSYGGDFEQSHRQTGVYAGRVLSGETPSELPVQQVTKLELFINLRSARRLGVAFPPALIGSADWVIE